MPSTVSAAPSRYTLDVDKQPANPPQRDRIFFTGVIIALLAITAAGFSWSTYVRTRPGATAFGGPTLLPLVRLHATVMTSWLLFLLLQTSLVATGRTNVHRRLGMLGGVLALGVVVSGWLVTFQLRPLALVRSATFIPTGAAFEFTIVPAEELAVFIVLTGLALHFRRAPAVHKRLMLLGTLPFITAGATRLPLPGPLFAAGFFGVPEAIVVGLLMRHDVVTRGRIQLATILGGALVVIGAIMRLWIAHTSFYFAAARWLSS